ncbi:hypothetical protein MKX03_017898, partial [Papaver bracteatum]
MAKIPTPPPTILGREAAVGSLTYQQNSRGKSPIYAIVFNFWILVTSMFLVPFVKTRLVNVYQCLEGGVITVLQSYVDENKEESFYTLSWACNTDGNPLLVAGGLNRIIRVIDAGCEKIHKSLVGHGDSINEIRTQALKPSLVVSACKDQSVRIWNVHTGVCILILAGTGGHRDEVLSVDFHSSDIYRIVSSGMDITPLRY